MARYQAAGYRVEVIYVGVASAELCRLRVAQRVANGGHNIPEKQIFERYHGGLATIQAHYQAPDKLTLLDNSGSDLARNRQPLLTVEHGRIVQEAAGLPPWVAAIRDHIRGAKGADALPG